MSIPYSGAIEIMWAISSGMNGSGGELRLGSNVPEAAKKCSMPDGFAVSRRTASVVPVFLK